MKDLDTSILNKILKAAIFNQQPAMSGRFRPKLRYAHSGGKNPPRIVIHGNNLKQLQDSYTRYLENFFRRELSLGSTPLEITYKEQSNPYKSKPNLLNERQKKKRKRMIKRRKNRTMIKYVLCFLLLYLPLEHSSETFKESYKNLKPTPKKVPVNFEAHGVKRVDNYYWMRDDSRENPEVINHLNSENDYLEAWFLDGEDNRDDLFEEITNRIPKKEDSVPIRLKSYEYFRRYEPGNEHAIYIRRKDKNSEEIILIDVNELAKGKDFFQLANWSISPDENLMAYAEDTNGRRQYTIKFKDLSTNTTSEYSISNTSGSMGWSADGNFLFYVLRDEETLLPYKVMRHEVGTSQDQDDVVYEEKDSTFYTSVGNTRSMDYIEINISSTTSSEVRLLKANEPLNKPRTFLQREKDHLYSVDHDPADDRFIVESNWEAINFRLLETSLENSQDKDLWTELIPHRDDVLLQAVIPFPDHLVVMERQNGLRQLKILDKNSNSSKIYKL